MRGFERITAAVVTVLAAGTTAAGETEDADRALCLNYRASRHGDDGRAAGFAARALAARPPELPHLALPAASSRSVAMRAIDGRATISGHGSGYNGVKRGLCGGRINECTR